MEIRTFSEPGQRNTVAGPAVLCCLLLIGLSLTLVFGARAQQAAAVLQVPANPSMHPAPEQPIEYSHRTHLALGLTCETCHTSTASDALMGYPQTGMCMGCHSSIGLELPGVMQLAVYHASGEQVPWVRVYEVLPGVTWNHQSHIAASVDCAACHGDMALTDATAMTTSTTSMASCISCHQAHEADTACALCHAWPAE